MRRTHGSLGRKRGLLALLLVTSTTTTGCQQLAPLLGALLPKIAQAFGGNRNANTNTNTNTNNRTNPQTNTRNLDAQLQKAKQDLNTINGVITGKPALQSNAAVTKAKADAEAKIQAAEANKTSATVAQAVQAVNALKNAVQTADPTTATALKSVGSLPLKVAADGTPTGA